jgi:hypothetical protein
MPAVAGPSGQTLQLRTVGPDKAQIDLVVKDRLEQDSACPVHRFFGRRRHGSRLFSILSLASFLVGCVALGVRRRRGGA